MLLLMQLFSVTSLYSYIPFWLQQCIQCKSDPISVRVEECIPGTPAKDGTGVTGYDFILYVSASQSECPDDSGSMQTVAFATSCQTEMAQDRPIAGSINFCPDVLRGQDPDLVFAVTKHEVLHALGFSRTLFPFWRDPANNYPRTPRDSFGLPTTITPDG